MLPWPGRTTSTLMRSRYRTGSERSSSLLANIPAAHVANLLMPSRPVHSRRSSPPQRARQKLRLRKQPLSTQRSSEIYIGSFTRATSSNLPPACLKPRRSRSSDRKNSRTSPPLPRRRLKLLPKSFLENRPRKLSGFPKKPHLPNRRPPKQPNRRKLRSGKWPRYTLPTNPALHPNSPQTQNPISPPIPESGSWTDVLQPALINTLRHTLRGWVVSACLRSSCKTSVPSVVEALNSLASPKLYQSMMIS